uniref:Uncharacterized protein n=1 Tax=Arundo donax TaxID=35708 RepID=A0A0A9BK84_ARUDO
MSSIIQQALNECQKQCICKRFAFSINYQESMQGGTRSHLYPVTTTIPCE